MTALYSGRNRNQLYVIAGTPVYLPRLVVGLGLTALVAGVNYRGIRPSGLFQDVFTFGLIGIFALFTLLGFAHGSPANLHPFFARPGAGGAFLSIVLVMQIVLTWVYPWQGIVSGHVGTEVTFERAFGSHTIAQLILFAAFLSLPKVFNGNFVAATRMLYAIGRRNLVHPSLGRLHPRHGTPMVAIGLMVALTVVFAMLGDAILVPITEVGSLAIGIGWLSACAAYLVRRKREGRGGEPAAMAWAGAVVSLAIVLMKVVPVVPGSFTSADWIAPAFWSGLGAAFWVAQPR